jgi:hypothetical protein
VKWLWTIALAGALAGCAGAEYSPLQRDLAELAEMPQRFDNFVKRKTARGDQIAVAAPAESQLSEPAQPPPVQETQTALAQEPAVPIEPTVPPVPTDIATEATAPATAPASAPAPNLLEKLGLAKKQVVEPPPASVHEKIPEPLSVDNPLARPPWETFVEAGPNADNELDLDLLYGKGNVPLELQTAQAPEEQQVAVAKEPAALDLPPADDAVTDAPPVRPKSAKEADVVIKAVAVPQVSGAKGEGNAELTAAMRKALKAAGWPVLAAPRKDAITIKGRVAFGKAHGANQSVKIVWDVLTPDGKPLGDLKQDNAIPAGSLDETWGENAQYAADAAAEGIFKLIQGYR